MPDRPPLQESGVLAVGTRAMSRIFVWLCGEVVHYSESSRYYTVRVDPEIKHHCETVLISADEIVTEADWEIDQAQRRLRWARQDVEREVANMKRAKAALREARAEVTALKAELAGIKARHAAT